MPYQTSIQRRFIITDALDQPIRAFYTKDEALPYLSNETRLIILPKQPTGYKLAVTLIKEEAPF